MLAYTLAYYQLKVNPISPFFSKVYKIRFELPDSQPRLHALITERYMLFDKVVVVRDSQFLVASLAVTEAFHNSPLPLFLVAPGAGELSKSHL